ncbi:MAG: DinB family protein, partial [Verrucomicrobiota bacterium]|nr:DinB family protein [Verrucomicrobiota bacterium]
MRSSLILSIITLVAGSVASASAQSPAPAPSPATLRSLLVEELHSTHDKAEWFTPINAAVAGLTAEQAKWVPQNAQG